MIDLTGQTIGKWKIEKLLGTGGMGQVYQARHTGLDRLEALKVMHDHVAQSPDFRARFLQEARVIAALNQPYIVEIYDFTEIGGRLLLSMELLTDGSLRTLLDRRTQEGLQWPLAFSLDLVRQAADALAYAHNKGVVHRDIKPDNLLIQKRTDSSGQSRYSIKVSDFGLAKLAEGNLMTAAGMTVGTPAYMSPEQCQGLPVDGRTDIYALGVVLYELLTGYQPFNARTLSDAVQKHVYTPPPPPRSVSPNLPESVNQLVLRCLAKRPEDRFANAGELSTALKTVIGTGSAVKHATPPPSEAAAAPQVRMLDGAGQTVRLVSLPTTGLTVGSAPANQLVVDDPLVSRSHLRIEWSGRRARVTDLGSRHGTKIDGSPIGPQTPAIWNPGQRLQLGNYIFMLESAPAAHERIQIALANNETPSLHPGRPSMIQLRLTNRIGETQALLTLEGLPNGWAQTAPRPVTLKTGEQTTFTLPVLVPQNADGRPGDYPFLVRARSASDGNDMGILRTSLHVAEVVIGRMLLSPEEEQGRDQGEYHLELTNTGNVTARFMLNGVDPAKTLNFQFSPNQVEVPPGETRPVRLVVQAERRWLGGTRRFPFTIRAVAQDSVFEANATFVQNAIASWST